MSNLRLNLHTSRAAMPPAVRRRWQGRRQRAPLGRYLVNMGAISQRDLLHGLALQRRVDAPLGEILVAEGLASRTDVLRALARQYELRLVDLTQDPPDPRLAPRLPAALCLRFGAVPYRSIGDLLFVATALPWEFERLKACMGPAGRALRPVLAERGQIHAVLNRFYAAELTHRAATRVPAAESCRGWAANPARRGGWGGAFLAGLALSLYLAADWVLTAALLWVLVTLVMTTLLKAAALLRYLSGPSPPPIASQARNLTVFRLPRVSVMVPLFKEKEIAGALIARLARLTYPKSLLEVILVLEAGDRVTRATLARSDLPDWISIIEVPEADDLRTKPRALNYALEFCRGSIIGVWDAEDAPEPDQIEQVVTRFQEAPETTACLQGRLDYYNSRSNWLARCFTIEYATWWRVLLPGIAQLGLVVPLGGTTLFFRRDILKKLYGWDAHNVTEDADLGLRLARQGYTTEILPTVTFEEANCRAWPWVRQRSRWLKGFLVTWCVHMRAPRALLKDLGPLRFLGVQALFLATFTQFALAPLLWSLWLVLFGVPHPVTSVLGDAIMHWVVVLLLCAEALNLCVSAVAVSGPRHRHLLAFVPTLPLYFSLGALAAMKALFEFVKRPFYWDKTAHGLAPAPEPPVAALAERPLSDPLRGAPLPASAAS